MAGETPTLPGIDPKYLQILPKEDSPEKLAAIIGKPLKWFLKAIEFEILRDFVNNLRNDVDAISNRPIKLILHSQMDDGLGSLGYIFQPGDEKKMIIIWGDTNNTYTYNMLINPDIFPDNAEFRLFMLYGNNYCLDYQAINGNMSIVGNPALHYNYQNKTAILRLVKYDSTNHLIINYLT